MVVSTFQDQQRTTVRVASRVAMLPLRLLSPRVHCQIEEGKMIVCLHNEFLGSWSTCQQTCYKSRICAHASSNLKPIYYIDQMYNKEESSSNAPQCPDIVSLFKSSHVWKQLSLTKYATHVSTRSLPHEKNTSYSSNSLVRATIPAASGNRGVITQSNGNGRLEKQRKKNI